MSSQDRQAMDQDQAQEVQAKAGSQRRPIDPDKLGLTTEQEQEILDFLRDRHSQELQKPFRPLTLKNPPAAIYQVKLVTGDDEDGFCSMCLVGIDSTQKGIKVAYGHVPFSDKVRSYPTYSILVCTDREVCNYRRSVGND